MLTAKWQSLLNIKYTILSKTKTSYRGLAGGKYSLFIRVGLWRASSTDHRGPGRFLLRRKRYSIPAKISAIPCVKACFMLSRLETKWKDRRVDLAVSPMISSNWEFFFMRIQKVEPLRKSAFFLGAKDETGSHFSVTTAAAKTTACFAPQLSFLEVSYELFEVSSVYCTHPIRNEARKWKSGS